MVLTNVRELVREESPRGGVAALDRLPRVRREKDPPPERNRVRSGHGRQDPGEPSGVEARAPKLAVEFGEETLRDRGRDRNARQLPKSERRSEAICFSSTLYET